MGAPLLVILGNRYGWRKSHHPCGGLFVFKMETYTQNVVPVLEIIHPFFWGGFIVFVLIVAILIWKDIYAATSEERRRKKELREEHENSRIYNEEVAKAIGEGMVKEAQIEQYRQLRKEIESMPAYENWRQRVFEKFGGRRCMKCGSTENIEVDHRYKSFYSIVKTYGITNKDDAYGCTALWDVNNGAPLCKPCHDETRSSKSFNRNI